MSTRILIVDDSVSIRHLVRVFLEVHPDFDVCGEAADGVEGVEKAVALKPDLIVLDGLEAATVLQETMPRVTLVLFTFFDDETLRHRARIAGIASVVSKIGPMDELRKEVRRLAPAA
jgi:two-component system response regulator NreC